MEQSEIHSTVKEKFTTRMEAKREQCEIIKNKLANMKNPEFQKVVATFLQWCMVSHFNY